MLRPVQCPCCGASTPPDAARCEYCESYLLRLTPLERRSMSAAVGEGGSADGALFRSLRPLYLLCIAAGVGMCFWLYFIAFDDFSETELVRLSPIWFLLFHFGVSGLYTEKAVRLILGGKADSFAAALAAATAEVSPIARLVVWVVFTPPFALLGLRKVSSPLMLSGITTLAWAGLLYAFLVGVFPNL